MQFLKQAAHIQDKQKCTLQEAIQQVNMQGVLGQIDFRTSRILERRQVVVEVKEGMFVRVENKGGEGKSEE